MMLRTTDAQGLNAASAGPPLQTDNVSSGSRPVLSPSLSIGTPTLSSTVSSRFDIGVSSV